ncbi:hydroperoxide isomerase ALOXE3 [Xenopus tropicalis]|uniref:Arachidonate 15-lipoxygenase, type B n=1 Tax=Xenopus tropicalis TaxID=8364 RepID=F6Y069_XENTR|nr:hydroperoxide isomerase ALOXE3 [Xenopus tropicalis]
MFVYKIQVVTGHFKCARTLDSISIILIGSCGESTKHKLDKWGKDFLPGAVDEYSVSSKEDLGEILLVRIIKEQYLFFPTDTWFCSYITVTCPKGEHYRFPLYKWIEGFVTVDVPQGKGIIVTDGVSPIVRQQRESELEKKRETYGWKTYMEGAPPCINADSPTDLPPNEQFSFMKDSRFSFSAVSGTVGQKILGLSNCKESWKDLNDIKKVLVIEGTENSDLTSELWKEDTFFGYQFLNGPNPVMIKGCLRIPDNFPVADVTVSATMGPSTNLQTELQNRNIFLADYKILEGIPTNVINDEPQYLAAPMCLLWKSPQNKVVPLAIQLNQTPGEENPIFMPTDPKWDWTLAKMWVRNSEYQVHQIVTRLLYTHLFAEVFTIATNRQLPMGHPIYKLLVPHLRFTLWINILARDGLIGPGSDFDQFAATGKGGVPLVLAKAMTILTYSALCLPDDIESRGVEFLPNYFYRDDGMKIWQAVKSFVANIVRYYYPSDESVYKDPELQAWVAEIYKEGFLSLQSSGIPSSFATRSELIKYLTMVIFTCSAQHAAVNSGQFDFYSWMPNGPSTMRKPPPTTRGTATYQSILETLPAVNVTAISVAYVHLLSTEAMDRRPLGTYPDEHFTEEMPKIFIKEFQEKLAEISKVVKERNQSKRLKYHYLDPEVIENSVSI